jgi:hypothetical protein
MKSVTIPSIGNPGTFVPLTSGDATYYTEAASFDMRKLFWDLNQAGYNITQIESSDVDSIVSWIQGIHSDLNDFIEDFVDWLEEGGTYPSEPTLDTPPTGYEFFYGVVIDTVNRFYGVLSTCRRAQINRVLNTEITDHIDDFISQEGILDIGDHRVWMKSRMVDAIT